MTILREYEEKGVPVDFQWFLRYVDLFLQNIASESAKPVEHFNICSNYITLVLLDCIFYVKDNVSQALLDGIDYKKYFYQLIVDEHRRKRGVTLLHRACTNMNTIMPSIQLVPFLVEIGADVNAQMQDVEGQTPLHYAAIHEKDVPGGVDLLLRHDAHADMVDQYNRTARDYLEDGIVVPSLDQPLRFQTLKCLAARAVCKYDIPYSQHVLPRPCIELIEQHAMPREFYYY
jgi:hypothetical protein